MLKKLTLLFLLMSFTFQAQEWNLIKGKTAVNFTIKNFGVNVDGSFKEYTIRTNFNKNQPEQSFIRGEILVNSIETGIKGRDEHLLNEDYFDAKKHPLIKFETKSIKKTNQGVYLALIDITIKGKNKMMEIPLTVNQENKNISIKSNFEINRRDFEVGGGSLILSKKVRVSVEFYGNKID